MDKVKIEYQVLPIQNPKYIAIADLSTWSYISDKESEVDIKIAGYNTYTTLPWQKGAINIFNSSNLQQSTNTDNLVDLPDGIYEINVKGSPSDKFSYRTKFLRTYLMNLEIDKILISTDLECDGSNKTVEKLKEIEFLIKSAEASVRYDNINRASELLDMANKRLLKLKNC